MHNGDGINRNIFSLFPDRAWNPAPEYYLCEKRITEQSSTASMFIEVIGRREYRALNTTQW